MLWVDGGFEVGNEGAILYDACITRGKPNDNREWRPREKARVKKSCLLGEADLTFFKLS